MSKISSVKTEMKKFSGTPMAATSKLLGAATVASVVYDAHINGREKAYSLDEVKSADRFSNQFKQYMTMDKKSATLAKLKKMWYNGQQNFSYYHIASRAKGYLSGFGETLVYNIPLLALSAVSLSCKNIGKVTGALIALHDVKTLLFDVMGIGAKKNERNY